MKIITTVIAATAFLFPLTAQADHHGAKPTKNVVEIAASAKDFSTLVAAVKAGGLAGALSGEGPFTIFAPTNAAFAKLPEGTVATLLTPGSKGELASVL